MEGSEAAPVWFVTGAGRGLGRALAEQVLARGWRLVATARDVGRLKGLAEQGRVLTLPLDMTEPDQIAAAITEATAAFGAIDVLVNNAGYGYFAAVEEGDPTEVGRLFQTNVLGPAALLRAALPGMRARRRGCVVNISSVGGLAAFEGTGYYAATKFALEGLSESLAKEMAPLGVRVLLVEPGGIRTEFAGPSMRHAAATLDDYDPTVGLRRRTLARQDGAQPGDPERVARIIIDAVRQPDAPLRLVLGRIALGIVRDKLTRELACLEEGAALSLSADFPS